MSADIKELKQQVNLYQPAFQEEAGPFGAARMSLLLLTSVVAGALLYGYAYWQVELLSTQVDDLVVQRQRALARVETIAATVPERQASALLERELARLSSGLDRTAAMVASLGRYRERAGSGFASHLEGLARQRVDGLWLTGFRFSDGGQDIEIRGSSRAPELVPVLVQRLSAEPAFSGTRFASLEIERAGGDGAHGRPRVLGDPGRSGGVRPDAPAGAADSAAGDRVDFRLRSRADRETSG